MFCVRLFSQDILHIHGIIQTWVVQNADTSNANRDVVSSNLTPPIKISEKIRGCMLRKLKMYIKTLFDKLTGSLTSGYLAYCEDCGRLERLSYLKDTQKFMCHDCIVRYAKLYIKINYLDKQGAYVKI